jgi:8-oxo-dGTP pyrophosphatase MutT (NUDIX family)
MTDKKDPKIEILCGDNWIQLRRLDGWYTYAHEIKCDGRFVAILGYDSKTDKIFMRYEDVPPHRNGIQPVAFTGGVEKGELFLDAAVREFREESGFACEAKDFIALGTLRQSKGTDSLMMTYAVDLAGKTGGSPEGDGTRGEEPDVAFAKWIPRADAIVNTQDAVFLSMYCRAAAMGLFELGAW